MNKLVKEIREALKPHRVGGFTIMCFPMPTLQQVEQLIAEVERLTAERSATDFICYLIDNCEGGCFLSEELLQQWYADFLKAKKAAEEVRG